MNSIPEITLTYYYEYKYYLKFFNFFYDQFKKFKKSLQCDKNILDQHEHRIKLLNSEIEFTSEHWNNFEILETKIHEEVLAVKRLKFKTEKEFFKKKYSDTLVINNEHVAKNKKLENIVAERDAEIRELKKQLEEKIGIIEERDSTIATIQSEYDAKNRDMKMLNIKYNMCKTIYEKLSNNFNSEVNVEY